MSFADDGEIGTREYYRNMAEKMSQRIKSLEQQLADCESDHRQQVDKAVELHKQLEDAQKRAEILEAILSLMESMGDKAHTYYWDEHPEDYDEPCICATCRSYMGGE